MKKFAQVANLVLWIGLLIAIIFADQFGIYIIDPGPMHFGPLHIASVVLGLVGVVLAVIPLLGDKTE